MAPPIHVDRDGFVLHLSHVLKILPGLVHCSSMGEQLHNLVTNSSSEKLSQDSITCLTAPADFLNNSVLNPLLLALQAWLTSLIQSSNICLFVPSKVLMAVNIESLGLSLLTLASSGKLRVGFSGWLPSFPLVLTEYLPILLVWH